MSALAIGLFVAVAIVLVVLWLFQEWRDFMRPEDRPLDPLRGFRRLAAVVFVLVVVVGAALGIALSWPPEGLRP